MNGRVIMGLDEYNKLKDALSFKTAEVEGLINALADRVNQNIELEREILEFKIEKIHREYRWALDWFDEKFVLVGSVRTEAITKFGEAAVLEYINRQTKLRLEDEKTKPEVQ